MAVDQNGCEAVWLFGYGSLIFRADFPYLERRPASIHGWQRRFWQGSHDHRGTAHAPGRVVTLIRAPGAICRGVAYSITPEVFTLLDEREKNGYLRCHEELQFADGRRAPATVYIATEDNHAFLGAAPDVEIAAHIARSAGPSGSNIDYLNDLARALRELSAEDPHVFALEELLQKKGAF